MNILSSVTKLYSAHMLLFVTVIGLIAVSIGCGYAGSFASAPLEISADIIRVGEGGDFQAALDQANPGDTIELAPGALYRGPFTLPKKPGDAFITIKSSAGDDKLPPPGRRIDPAKYSSILPKLSSATDAPVITAASGAHHYRFIGIEFGGTQGGVGNIIKLGTGGEKSVDELPHHIEFDRVYIHATSPNGQRRGIAANGRFIKIANSHISGIAREGDESQAIAAWATDGPIEIVNNYLEAAAENILFGGGSSYLKLVPTNCIVRNNHLNKPLEWKGTRWVVKNLFEIKNGRNIKVENNLMTNNWRMGQDGTAILFSTRADNGPATIIEDIEFTGNIIRNSPHGISVFGPEGSGGHRLTIRNNLFENIGQAGEAGSGRFMKSTAWNGLTIENNTIINSGNIASAYGPPVRDFVFRDNIVFENTYGFKGDSTPSGNATIDKFFPNAVVTGNIIVGGNSTLYRQKNHFPPSAAVVGFVNVAEHDYRIRESSAFSEKVVGRKIGAILVTSQVGRN